ncbi:hypothetical protein Tco_1100530 [Tanacetum coccineum]
MEISIADQIALDDALVAPADRLKIGKCNLRLSSDITSKEATLQVVYDVLKLTPFYNYKAVRLRFSDPMIQPEPEGSTQGYPLVSVEVLSHGPSDAMHNPLPATQSQKDFVSKLTEIHSFLLTFSLRNIRVNSFTMKMEILLEPTSNKLMVEHAEYDESNTYVLERFNTTAGNPVKKILLKLNLSDHRLFEMVVEVPDSSYFRYSDTTHLSRSVKVLKLKNFKKDATLKLFKNGMSMSVQKSQVHKMAKFQDGKEIVLG